MEEKKFLFLAVMARFADRDQSLLNVVKCLLGNHRHMNALMQFSLVCKHTVVKRIVQHIVDRVEARRLLGAVTDKSGLCHLLLNGSK